MVYNRTKVLTKREEKVHVYRRLINPSDDKTSFIRNITPSINMYITNQSARFGTETALDVDTHKASSEAPPQLSFPRQAPLNPFRPQYLNSIL